MAEEVVAEPLPVSTEPEVPSVVETVTAAKKVALGADRKAARFAEPTEHLAAPPAVKLSKAEMKAKASAYAAAQAVLFKKLFDAAGLRFKKARGGWSIGEHPSARLTCGGRTPPSSPTWWRRSPRGRW